jgi:WD40 repeat protein
MAIIAGTRLGPYEILAPLGVGGMGEVYRARDTRLGRDVALKVIHPRLATDPERLSRFEKEARAAAQLDHPNILVLHDIGSHEGSPYIVSELLEGESLREKLGEPLPPKKAVDYAVQIAHGLAAAHEKGIVHRDIKPENVFVTKDGHVKILDFGLAKLIQPAVPSVALTEALTATPTTDANIIMGTVGYMSPEQVQGKPLDARSDLFSLGVVVYEMLSGKRPFQKDTAAETMAAILKEEPAELSGTDKPVPPGLDRIVRHCLEKEPSNRFQSARDIAFDLEALTGISGASAATRALPRERRMRRLRWAGAVSVLTVALGLAFLLGRRTAETEPSTFHRLTWRRGTVLSARFAPDGQTVLYSASWDGGPSAIYIKRPESPDAVPLGLPSAVLLAVSLSGEMAIQLNSRPAILASSQGTLARAPFTGGTPREIAEGIVQADWGPGGSLVVSRNAGARRLLEYPLGKILYETTGYVGSPRLSPRGDLIAFIDHPIPDDDLGSIAIVDLSGKKRILSKEWGSVRGLSWSPSGSEVWFTASMGGNHSLYGVSLSGRQRTIARMPADVLLLDVNRAGRVLLIQADERMGIKYFGPGESRERDLSWLNWSLLFDISPDGRTIVMNEDGGATGPNYVVCLRRTDGSPVLRLGEGYAGPLSPDGKWVSSRMLKPGSPIVLLPTGSGEPKEIPSQGLSNVLARGWFPDGKWLLALAQEEGRGPNRLFMLSVDGEKPRAVSGEGAVSRVGNSPVSPDGRLVAAVGADRKIALYPVVGGEPRPVPGSAEDDLPLRWSAGGDSLFVSERMKGLSAPARIYTLDIRTGARVLWKELFPEDSAGVIGSLAVCITPDGQSYAYSYHLLLSELYVAEGLK